MSIIFLGLLILLGYPFYLLSQILHALGSALMALLITRERVKMYIGSYGDTNNNISFKTGLLDWRIRPNIFYWRGNMCVANTTFISSERKMLYLAAGSAFPFVIAVISFSTAYYLQLPEIVWMIAMVFCLVTVFLIFQNLIPSKNPIQVRSGNVITYNDGELIRREVNRKKAEQLYLIGEKYHLEENYTTAATYFEQGINKDPESVQLYELLMVCYLQMKEYLKAEQLAEQCIRYCTTLNETLNFQIGNVYAKVQQYERGLHYYTEALKFNPEQEYAWYNKGFMLYKLKYYDKAMPCFTKAISLNDTDARFHDSFGMAQIRIGNLEEGVNSLKRSLELDDTNAIIYRNLGVYHLQKQHYKEAREALLNARAKGYTGADLENLLIEASGLRE